MCPPPMKYARRALDLVSEDDHLLRGAAAGFLGLAYWTNGDLEEAHRSYAECMARMQRAGYISDAHRFVPSPWRIYGLRRVVSTRP